MAEPGPDPAHIFATAPCGLLATTMQGAIVAANDTFLGWTGFSRDDVVGRKTLTDLLSPGARIYHETHYSPLLRMQGDAREIAIEFVASDGRRLPALVNAVVRPGDGVQEDSIIVAVFPAEDRRRYERELMLARRRAEESEARATELAQTLQASLIPPVPPAIPFLDVGAAYRPAGTGEEVGGDFYDVFEVADGEWAVMIGDVRGKGVQAAAVTALARYTLRAAAIQLDSPAEVLAMLNLAMMRQRGDTFCTVIYARIAQDGPRAEVSLAVGGHPLPVHLAGDAEPRSVGTPGTLLGVFDEPMLHDTEVTLAPAETLVLYTDGVTEGRRGPELYGETRFLDLLARHKTASAGEIVDETVGSVLAFQDGRAKDDIAVVAIKVP